MSQLLDYSGQQHRIWPINKWSSIQLTISWRHLGGHNSHIPPPAAVSRGYHKTIMGRILFPPHTPSPRFYIMSVRCYYGIRRFNYRMPPQTSTLFTGAQSFCSLWLICHGAAELQITGGRPQSVNRVDYVCKNKRVMRLVGFMIYSILTSIHI